MIEINFPFEHFPREIMDAVGNWHPKRRLYVFQAVITKPVVYSNMNEVHKTGETVRDPIMWSVIAPDNDHAEFAFWQRFGPKRFGGQLEPSDITVEVFPVCAEITKMQGG